MSQDYIAYHGHYAYRDTGEAIEAHIDVDYTPSEDEIAEAKAIMALLAMKVRGNA